MSPHRDTIHLESAEILANDPMGEGQYVMRLAAPRLARRAAPGQFAHVQCDDRLAMRRPLSVMRVDADDGWADFLYKDVGVGTTLLASQPVGGRLSVLGPIGTGFHLHPNRSQALLIGGGVGIPPMIFLADRLRADDAIQPLVLMGSEIVFPFSLSTSGAPLAGIASEVHTTMAMLDDWGVASRLASQREFEGCFVGYVTDLARDWLAALEPDRLREVGVYACGPLEMLKATNELASAFNLPCQVCLEEYMACGVGGCAGCTVRVRAGAGESGGSGSYAMKRVCVDGPVFDARAVVWN